MAVSHSWHHANTPLQYTAILKAVKMKISDCDVFLIFAENIDCGYLCTHNLFLEQK